MFNTRLSDIFEDEKLVKMVFSNKRKKSLEYSKVTIKPLILKGRYMYQAEFAYDKKVIHDNIPASEIAMFCNAMIRSNFKQVNIFTTESEIQVLASKADDPKIIEKKTARDKADLSHNKKKNYCIPEGEPCDFLIHLGVMTKDGQVIHKHYSKFRQINRFLEIVEDCLDELPKDRKLRIIDFGCGKSYLTFALYYYLHELNGYNVSITGLDLKKDVIKFCNKVAEELNYEDLTFLMGDIADYTNDHADMVVTLHACDTATDYALINAVSWNTRVILSVPCCQHEMFKQIDNDILNPMLKHGIIKDKFTELLTDGLRGLKLEEMGYKVDMIEFTTLEHTSKNIMIRAVKGIPYRKLQQKAHDEYEALKEAYNVTPAIDQMKRPKSEQKKNAPRKRRPAGRNRNNNNRGKK